MTAAQDRLNELIDDLDNIPGPDTDTWSDEFLDPLKERVAEVSECDDVVVAYLSTQMIENEVNNGGFAQAFINLGVNSQFFTWAVDGYKERFALPDASDVLERAVMLARSLEKDIQEAGKSIEAASAFFQKGLFAELDHEAGKKMFITNETRAAYVVSHRDDFKTI